MAQAGDRAPARALLYEASSAALIALAEWSVVYQAHLFTANRGPRPAGARRHAEALMLRKYGAAALAVAVPCRRRHGARGALRPDPRRGAYMLRSASCGGAAGYGATPAR